MILNQGEQIKSQKNEYIIERLVSQGGMGYVYLARDHSNNNVIVKTPLKDDQDGLDSARIERLKVEANILKEIQHPNIVRYLDEIDQKSDFDLIIEYITGKNLKSIYSKNPADDNTVIKFILKILEIIAYLHGQSKPIIHRDINSKNIMRDNDERLVLLDFGAAKQGYTQLSPGTQIGTPFWSAPEQINSGYVTETADIYSIGVLMFFLLTGEDPRAHMTAEQKLLRTPKQVNLQVSTELSEIVIKAMQSDPSKRYSTSSDMMNAIKGRVIQKLPPHIILGGIKYRIKNQISIGRKHIYDTCRECKQYSKPDILIDDYPNRYIGKHHLEVTIDNINQCHIKDLNSINHTAIRSGANPFKVIPPNSPVILNDKDIVAICYRTDKGPYLTFTFSRG